MDSAAVGIFSSSQGGLLFLGLPDFVWSGIFSLLATLIAGVVVATFTTAFLKKREEKIRVSGELFQRRVEAQSALSNFLIQRLVFETVEEMDPDVLRLVGGVELADTHPSPQRSKIFDSLEDCNRFLDDYRQLFYSNKTWLDRRVRDQLLLIQYYLEAISGVWFYATKVPLPDSGSLTKEELDLIQGRVIRVVGVVADNDLNAMLGILDNEITRSVYKVDFKTPKNSWSNRNHRKIASVALHATEFGDNFHQIVQMVIEEVVELRQISFDDDDQAAVFALELLSNCRDIGGALENIEKDGMANYFKRHSPRAW